MPQEELQSQVSPLQNKLCKKEIIENGHYCVEPNELKDAWVDGVISVHCYKLVSLCLRHSEEFQLKNSYLLSRFGNDPKILNKAKKEAIEFGILTITKVRIKSSYINHYNILSPKNWKLSQSSQVEKPTGGKTHGWENPRVEIPSRIRRTTLKKNKLIKNTMCEERARAAEESHKDTHTEWVSNYSPETIVNRLADLGCLKMGGKGFIENVTFWNREARTALRGLETDQIKEFIVFVKQSLGRRKLELSEGILSTLVTTWHSEENKPISSEPEYVQQEEHYEVRDDMPF